MSDATMLSRSLAGGKRTAKVEGRVTDETKFALQRRCHEIGVSESDYIDRLVLVSLHGLEHVSSLEQERLRRVCGLSAIPGDGQ